MQPATLWLLPAIGVGVGFVAPRSGWKCALATTAVFPVLALRDMILDPTSHNLLPFEFALYAALALLAAVPALLVGLLCLWIGRRHRTSP
jgi:hypothetical protein